MVAKEAEAAEADGDKTIATLVFHTAREMRTALERRLSNHGVTAQQAMLARLLRMWERKKRPSPFQIASRLGTDGAGITRLIDRLEAKGVVVRQIREGDRRSISIELTASGLAIARAAAPTVQNVDRQLLDGFSKEEVQQLVAMLQRLRENARNLSR